MTCIAICGDSASGKSTFANFLAKKLGDTTILETDMYHKWERDDTRWQTMTQLNPAGNYIQLMNEDVAILKDGASVWRKEYDHSIGKFNVTARQIVPSRNLIVCGLHVLMCPDHLYDFKIFLDPSDEEKHEWKISRDIKERGYTLERVEEQIRRRQVDFKEFIEPFKSKADLVLKSWSLYAY